MASKKVIAAIKGSIANPEAAAAVVAPIADPSTATAEDVATKLNVLIAALQG